MGPHGSRYRYRRQGLIVNDATKTAELTWMMDDFVRRVVGIDRAVVLSSDGLLIGRSSSLSHEDGEHLSAVASAFQSLAVGTSRHFQGRGVRQTMVEMEDAFLFVMAAGQGACLAALAVHNADLGLIAYEMNRLVKRVGTVLSAAPRSIASIGSGNQV